MSENASLMSELQKRAFANGKAGCERIHGVIGPNQSFRADHISVFNTAQNPHIHFRTKFSAKEPDKMHIPTDGSTAVDAFFYKLH